MLNIGIFLLHSVENPTGDEGMYPLSKYQVDLSHLNACNLSVSLAESGLGYEGVKQMTRGLQLGTLNLERDWIDNAYWALLACRMPSLSTLIVCKPFTIQHTPT